MDRDKVVLDYHHSLLLASDVKLLREPHWLNDKIIGFALEYFENDKFKSYKNTMTFLNPSVVQLVKVRPETEAQSILDPLHIQSSKLIFIPVNDNPTLYPGGMHWSLLVCDLNRKKFFYFDSLCSDSYSDSANRLCSRFDHYLESSFSREIPRCPTQSNGYDCGVFVIAIVEKLADLYSSHPSLIIEEVDDFMVHINAKAIKDKRKELHKIISTLSKKH